MNCWEAALYCRMNQAIRIYRRDMGATQLSDPQILSLAKECLLRDGWQINFAGPEGLLAENRSEEKGMVSPDDRKHR